MKYLISILIIIFPIIIGLITELIEKNKVKKSLDFGNSYLDRFHAYMNSSGKDVESYIYLTKKSNEMQNQLGVQGLMTVQQPFNRGIINNYTIILTGIPQVQSYLSEEILRSQAVQLARYIVDALLRNIGDYEKALDIIYKNIKNPIVLYRVGWNQILSIPFLILFWLGVYTKKILDFLTRNILFKAITSIVSILGLISSIMTIVLGYEEFVVFLKNFFDSF